MLRFLSRPLTLAVLVTLLIWLVVIIYWQETARQVSGTEIGMYLFGLPLLVITLGLGVRYLYRRRASAASPAAAAADGSPTPSAATDERERAFSLALLAVGLVCSVGTSGADVYADLKENKSRPLPDGELKSGEGFPITACRVADLDTKAAEAVLSGDGGGPAEGISRALALLGQALEPILEILMRSAPPQDKPEAEAVTPQPKLVVDLLVPDLWQEGSRLAAARHFTGLLAENAWPAEACRLEIVPAAEGAEAMRRLDRFNLAANRDKSADLYLLAACESMIDEALVASLDADNQLFAVANPQGRIPGEGAVAVLVRAPAALAAEPVPAARLSRAAFRQRSKSADAGGRIGHEMLLETAQQCLEAAAVSAESVGAMISDIDQRASRTGECLGTLEALLPELDSSQHFAGIGQALGRLDVSGALLALGVAAAAAQAEEKPVLLAVALPPKDRATLLVTPFAAAEDAETAANEASSEQ